MAIFRTTISPQVKIIIICLLVLGPLVAVVQIQWGERAGLKAAAERSIVDSQMTIQQAEAVRDISAMYPEDVLLLDQTVPEGERADLLLNIMQDVAANNGGRVSSVQLMPDNADPLNLQLSLYRASFQSVQTIFSNVTYAQVKNILNDLSMARRPVQITSWSFDSAAKQLHINARVVFIEKYVDR